MSHNTESIFRAHIDAERKDENLTRYQHVAGNRASLARRRTELQWRRFEESKRKAYKPLPLGRPAPFTPLQPYHLTAYGATQEQAERVLRDQSEDREQPRYFVVGYEHPTKGTRYYVQNRQRQRVSINASAERATAWAVLYERQHPEHDGLVSEDNAELSEAPQGWRA